MQNGYISPERRRSVAGENGIFVGSDLILTKGKNVSGNEVLQLRSDRKIYVLCLLQILVDAESVRLIGAAVFLSRRHISVMRTGDFCVRVTAFCLADKAERFEFAAAVVHIHRKPGRCEEHQEC